MRKIVNIQTGEVTEAEDAPVTQLTQSELDAIAAHEAEMADRLATIQDPFVQAIATMTPQEVKDTIDSTFPAMTAGQRQVLKAVALAARFAIRKG